MNDDMMADPPSDTVARDESPTASASNGTTRAPLPDLARRAMQRLLATGVVLRRSHADDFDHLKGHQSEVNALLIELGLSMLVKPEHGMAALIRLGTADVLDGGEELEEEEDDDDDGNRALLRVTRLRFYHSIILSVLRAYYREREVAMDSRVVIEIETLKDRLRPFTPLIQSESRNDKHLFGAIRLLERHAILLNVRDNKDAREISPVILLAMSVPKAQAFEAEIDRHIAALKAPQESTDGV